MAEHKNALIIFLRKPELGKVKTRLAAQIGNEKALMIYIRLLEHTFSVIRAAECDTHIFTTGMPEDQAWKGFQVHLQVGNDLGERMLHAFKFLFSKQYHKVVIIGSDCPGLRSDHITAAFAALETNDIVAGPAKDGGYYLLGMKKLYPELFFNKKWSTSSVLNDTLKTIKDLHVSAGLLETLIDIDEVMDLPEDMMGEFFARS